MDMGTPEIGKGLQTDLRIKAAFLLPQLKEYIPKVNRKTIGPILGAGIVGLTNIACNTVIAPSPEKLPPTLLSPVTDTAEVTKTLTPLPKSIETPIPPEDLGQVVAPDGLPVPGEANIPVGTKLKVGVFTDPANPNIVKGIQVTTPGGRTLELSNKDFARLKLSEQALKDAKPYVEPTPTPTPLPSISHEFVRLGFSYGFHKSDAEYPLGPFLVRMPWADKTGNDSYADFSKIDAASTRTLAKIGWDYYTPEYVQKQIDSCKPSIRDHCIEYWSQFGDIKNMSNPLGIKTISIMPVEQVPSFYKEDAEGKFKFAPKDLGGYSGYGITVYNMEVEEIEYYAAPLSPGGDLYSRGKFKDINGKDGFMYFKLDAPVFGSIYSAPRHWYQFSKLTERTDPRMIKKGMIIGFVDGGVTPYPYFYPERHFSPEMLKNFDKGLPSVVAGGVVIYWTPFDECCR